MRLFERVGLIIFFFFVIAPTLTLIHELGHGLIPLFEGEKVSIGIGGYTEPPPNAGQLSVAYVSAWKPWAGFTKWSGERGIFRLSMGPLTSLAMAFLFLFLLSHTSNKNLLLLLRLSLCWVACGFVVTAFPLSYPKFILQNPTDASDGRQIMEILQTNR